MWSERKGQVTLRRGARRDGRSVFLSLLRKRKEGKRMKEGKKTKAPKKRLTGTAVPLQGRARKRHFQAPRHQLASELPTFPI